MTADDIPEHLWIDKQNASSYILAALRDVPADRDAILNGCRDRLVFIPAAIVDVVLLVCPELRERGAQVQEALLNYADMGATEVAEGGWDIDPEPPRWTELLDE